MKKIFFAVFTVAILLSFEAQAQLTVSTLPTGISGLNEPYNVVEDTNYNIYISDSGNHRIVMINGNNQSQSVLSGTTGSPGATDGPYYNALFNNPQGMLAVTINGTNGLLVADTGNQLIRFVRLSDGYVTTLAGIAHTNSSSDNIIGTNATFAAPYGLTQDDNGHVYIVDLTANRIRVMNLNDPNFGVSTLNTPGLSLNHPWAVAFMGTNQLWVADTGNNTIKLITLNTNGSLTGHLTTYIGSDNPGTTDSLFGSKALFNQPSGLLWVPGLGLLISDTGNNSIRLATNNPTFGATNYSVTTFAGTPGTAGSANGSLLSASFYSPIGICLDSMNSAFLVADLKNNFIRRVGDGLPPPPPAPPTNLTATATLGQVTLTWSPVNGATNYIIKNSAVPGSEFPITPISSTTSTTFIDTNVTSGQLLYYVVFASNAGGESSNSTEVSITVPYPRVNPPVFGTVSDLPDINSGKYSFTPVSQNSTTYNNDTTIAIECPDAAPSPFGTPYYITWNPSTNTPPNPDLAPNPQPFTPFPLDGSSLPPKTFQIPSQNKYLSDITISAQGFDINTPSKPHSAVVSRQFHFIVANPSISGNNAAQFQVSDITASAHLYYTIDGSDPSSPINTNRVDMGTLPNPTNSWAIKLTITSNILFQAWASKGTYQPSAIVSNLFLITAFQPTSLTFGLTNGEPHSRFLARPGQIFYAPVTMQLPPGFGNMYSLALNVAVTNGLVNTNTGSRPPSVQNGAGIGFVSMLMSQVPNPQGQFFPPADGQPYLPIPPFILNNFVTNTPPNSTFVDTNLNLLGISWLYRSGFAYLALDSLGNTILNFDTKSQDLITYSIAHDILFNKSGGVVLVGAFSFTVPQSATNGDAYFIQLGTPSATSDGVGAPGSSIPFAVPGSNQVVTVGSPAYLVGDAAPFHWFNAGDFGDNNLDNSDVMQVFQCAIFNPPIDMPPTNSDLFMAMDSAGSLGGFDLNYGYFTNSILYTNKYGAYSMTNLWNGNDTTINQMPFGDGVLDINDLYVTLRRSLDPSLVWFQRYWTNNQLVAVTNIPNKAYNTNIPHALLATTKTVATLKAASIGNYQNSLINFTAGDIQASAGQTGPVTVQIYANVIGDYPLRVLGLDLKVVPLDGSPEITQPVIFSPAAGLGNPSLPTITRGPAEFGAAWLDSSIAGLTGNALVGTLTITLPTNTTTTSAYAVHFAKVSGSPNGLAIFPKNTQTGLITLSSRTNSSFNDNVPDSWRLRWFGTANPNITNYSAALSASGDGISNYKKYIAGVDPTIANNFPSLNAKSSVPSGFNRAVHWPTVSGKKYLILSSDDIFSSQWQTNATVTGTGADMEFDDNSAGTRFYRVQILP